MSKTINSAEDTTVKAFPISAEESLLSDVYFIKLVLKENGQVIADNFYWEGKQVGNWQAINKIPLAKLDTKVVQNSDASFTVTIANKSEVPALMIRLNLLNSKNGEQILPAFYQDNYFCLLGGETKTVTVSYLTNEHPADKKFKPTVTVEQLR